jgi:hypothetical protein
MISLLLRSGAVVRIPQAYDCRTDGEDLVCLAKEGSVLKRFPKESVLIFGIDRVIEQLAWEYCQSCVP